jgi:hypothetical protein
LINRGIVIGLAHHHFAHLHLEEDHINPQRLYSPLLA